ncbi:MAG: sugar kinase [Cyanobacteria bacterium SIG26]|nr:sugar kinase [Cyanobacteria bacterium SIG26]
MTKEFDIITIGECLIEFSTNQKLEFAECLHKYYGGDSLVVAIAAKRLGSNVGFVTCLGNDAFKDYMLTSWDNEGLDTRHVKIVEEKNGIYMVSRPSLEEKEFIYYRNKIAPAKLSINDIDEDYIKSTKIIYASGITQSLSMGSREAVKRVFEIAKENGVITAYDPNYSSLISTNDEAKEFFDEIIPLTDILFMSSKYDTKSIFEIESLENIMKVISDIGVQTIVIKSSNDKGYHISNHRTTTFVPFYTDTVIDTTSSGDAFNGAFLHAIANSYTPTEAAKIASIDAGIQAQGIGAVKSTPYGHEVYEIYNSGAF